MRVASFNICHGSRGVGTAVDLAAVIAACRGFDADLIALQEVARQHRCKAGVSQAALVADALGMDHAFAPARRGGDLGNALLARGEIGAVEVLRMSGRFRLGRRDRRNALLARVIHGGRPVSVAVTHLSIHVEENLPQQDAVLAALVRRPAPHLLLGDLNRRTAWVSPGARRCGLTLADDDVPTFSRDRPRYRIDHLAVRGLVIADVQVVDTGTSDHRALLADLVFDSDQTSTGVIRRGRKERGDQG